MNINEFKDNYFFLSNFFMAPVEYDGLHYSSSEAAYQAQKCKFPSERKQFQNLNPSKSKALGRAVAIREDWEDVKDSVMLDIVRCKFEQNQNLKRMLIETGDAHLEEGNYWGDRYWGTVNGEGKNKLGEILMTVRNECKQNS